MIIENIPKLKNVILHFITNDSDLCIIYAGAGCVEATTSHSPQNFITYYHSNHSKKSYKTCTRNLFKESGIQKILNTMPEYYLAST
jgi:hypothetical protein